MTSATTATLPGKTPSSVPPSVLVAVLGVVYGDIGTSPLYAFRECFRGPIPLAVTTSNVLGVLSLIFWALVIIISLKYMVFILRTDNRGEGGIFALIALLTPAEGAPKLSRRTLLLVGLFGASLLYGDAMITPAISVLSAVEGLGVRLPASRPLIVPVAATILVALFTVQRRGTAGIGAVFGPVMLAWFALIAGLGVSGIVQRPLVLAAVNPWHAIAFLYHNEWTGFFTLAAVFLVVTGGEALYADLGHFNRKPIRVAWFGLVLPSLLLNYFGQGAALLADPSHLVHPFYSLAPHWAFYPVVALATAATVIASQAVITGAFSLTHQGIQLGLMPRLTVRQTSAAAMGQIYMPTVNWMMLAAALALVVGFGSSSRLAAAYGLSVSGTMAITTVLAYSVARERPNWTRAQALGFLIGFLSVDLAFLAANSVKIPQGGWLPLAIACALMTLITTWAKGSEQLAANLELGGVEIDTFLGKLTRLQPPPARVPGTAVFFTGDIEHVPPSLMHYLRLTNTLHQQVVLLTVRVLRVPKVAQEERFELRCDREGLYRVILRYGFMQGVNVPSDLAASREQCCREGLNYQLDELVYFIGRKSLITGRKKSGMARWREELFVFLTRNTQPATVLYQVPSDQVLEIGLQVGI
jgi:KUP system potassium uptake protein